MQLLFGAAYCGETSEVYMEMFNNSPLPTDFVIRLRARKDAEQLAASDEDPDEEEEKVNPKTPKS